MFYFHILYLNVNEWILVKGCIEVVPRNSVSMGSCDIVVYWEYGQMDHLWSLLLLLRPWVGYGYIGCMLGRAPRTKETLLDFFYENMDPHKRDTIVWYWVTRNPQEFHGLTSFQRDPQIWGCHNSKVNRYHKKKNLWNPYIFSIYYPFYLIMLFSHINYF